MKVNEVPEKLWWSEGAVWHTNPNSQMYIEYIRKNAFIEKVETYLKEQFVKDVSILAGGVVHINFNTAINNFINYMKGK